MMLIVFGILFLLMGWKFGDWKNFKKYYPTILFFIICDLLYNILTYNHPLWNYNKGWILPNHTLANLWIIITVYPATVITYLYHFPERKIKQTLYILLWVLLYIAWELLAVYIFWTIDYSNGWNMWWSILFDLIIFTMLPIHHKRPLVAWGFSIIIIIFFLIVFNVNLLELK